MIRIRLIIGALLIFLALRADCSALEKPETELKEVGIYTILGKKVDGKLVFSSAQGEKKTLESFYRPGIPTIITPVYYGCPRLCGLVLKGVLNLVNQLTLDLGTQYQIITVSFDPTEKPGLAVEKSKSVFAELTKGKEAAPSSWHFLTGDESNIAPLMNELGFHYKKDGDEYAHGSGIMILTPEGEISQYFTGIEYPSWDARLALVEASKGGIGTPIDHLLLFCFKFDPTKGKYTWAAFNALRIGVLMSVLFCAYLVYCYSRRPKCA